MTETDEFDLERFVGAQDAGGTYDEALAQLRRGRKTSHWMWFVLPQIAGLGHSAMAQRYAISSLAEARSYVDHPVLGRRLTECCTALTSLTGPAAADPVHVFGSIDAMKLQSSVTLFALAAPDEPLFGAILDQYFEGKPDPATQARAS